jgi:hypothetical protein
VHLGSSPPCRADDPAVQGVIGYVANGRWHYVPVNALFARLAAELALEIEAEPKRGPDLNTLGRDKR